MIDVNPIRFNPEGCQGLSLGREVLAVSAAWGVISAPWTCLDGRASLPLMTTELSAVPEGCRTLSVGSSGDSAPVLRSPVPSCGTAEGDHNAATRAANEPSQPAPRRPSAIVAGQFGASGTGVASLATRKNGWCVGCRYDRFVKRTPRRRRAATYLGLVTPQSGAPRSAYTRVFAPSDDSSRSELLGGLAVGLFFMLVFIYGIATGSWPWRILDAAVLILLAVPLCIKSGRRLRRST